MTFDPTSVEVLCVTLPKDHCVQVPWKYIKVCGYIDLFCKNLKQKLLTPRWPLTPHLLRSHVWLYPRIIVSKSHGNTSMYADTVINFAKNYHIHTHTYTYYIHIHTTYRISDHIVSFWTTFRRDKNEIKLPKIYNQGWKFPGIFLISENFARFCPLQKNRKLHFFRKF